MPRASPMTAESIIYNTGYMECGDLHGVIANSRNSSVTTLE